MNVYPPAIRFGGLAVMIVGLMALITWAIVHGNVKAYLLVMLSLLGFTVYFAGLTLRDSNDKH